MASSQPWRYRCPRGHCSWLNAEDGYYCQQCLDNGDDHYFDELVDVKKDGVPKPPT